MVVHFAHYKFTFGRFFAYQAESSMHFLCPWFPHSGSYNAQKGTVPEDACYYSYRILFIVQIVWIISQLCSQQNKSPQQHPHWYMNGFCNAGSHVMLLLMHMVAVRMLSNFLLRSCVPDTVMWDILKVSCWGHWALVILISLTAKL